jgi:hypothetical protein
MVMSKAFTLVSASVILGSAGVWYLSTTRRHSSSLWKRTIPGHSPE